MRRLIMIVITMLALAARATPHQHDVNDLWINPDESGWGLNLFHHGDTIFASLFVYGQDGKPRWYTASNMTGPDAGPLYYQAAVYSGDLYESTGPGIGGPFDPSRVTRRRVGSMTFQVGYGVGDRRWGHVDYDIDGVRVSKQVYPFGFRLMDFSGTYTGFRGQPGSATSAGAAMYEEITATIVQNGTALSMTTVGTVSGSCAYTGTIEPNGHLGNAAGNYSCNGSAGGFSIVDWDVTPNGLTSLYRDGRIIDRTFGGMVLSRSQTRVLGNGNLTDLWFDTAESGWGLNVIDQGDTIFATLFVYDAQGRPRWYSASNLAFAPGAPPDAASDNRGHYTGALVESTGPWFGGAFNPAQVTRRQVGTMTIDFYGNDTASLDYSVDGVTVLRKPLRRASLRAQPLAGRYSGHIVLPPNTNDRGVQTGAMTFENTEGADGITLVMRGSRGECTLRVAWPQVSELGHLLNVTGDYDCGGTRIGRMAIWDMDVNWSGFTGFVNVDGYSIGRIEALRTTTH